MSNPITNAATAIANTWRGITGTVRTAMQTLSGQSNKVPWPPVSAGPMLAAYNRGLAVYEGRHQGVFEALGFRLENPGRPYIATNLCKMLTDLLVSRAFAEAFTITAPDNETVTEAAGEDGAPGKPVFKKSANQELFDYLYSECRLQWLVQQAATGQSYSGKCAFKVVYDGDAEELQIVTPNVANVFPEWDPLDRKRLVAANIENPLTITGADGKEKSYLWQERHELREDGQSWVLNKLYRLEKQSVSIGHAVYTYDPDEDQVQLAAVPQLANMPEEEPTGIPQLLVVYMDEASAYTDALLSLQGEYNHRVSQRADVQDKHVDPLMSGPALPESCKVGPKNARRIDMSLLRYVEVQNGEKGIERATWDAQLSSVDSALDRLKTDFALSAGVDASALFAEAGAVASGTALRRQQMRTQGTALMTQELFRQPLQEVLGICAALAAIKPLEWSPSAGKCTALDADEITIEFGDGLPPDRMEEVTETSTLVEAGLESGRDAIKALFGLNDQEAEEKWARIQEEKKSTRPPSPFGGGLPGVPPLAAGRFAPVTPGAEAETGAQ